MIKSQSINMRVLIPLTILLIRAYDIHILLRPVQLSGCVYQTLRLASEFCQACPCLTMPVAYDKHVAQHDNGLDRPLDTQSICVETLVISLVKRAPFDVCSIIPLKSIKYSLDCIMPFHALYLSKEHSAFPRSFWLDRSEWISSPPSLARCCRSVGGGAQETRD